MRSPLRSVGAVFAGLLAIVVPSIATDMALRATGVYPPPGQRMSDTLFLLATAYRIVYGVAGIGGTVATWGRGPEFGPVWYSLAIIAIAVPCGWMGGRLRGMQLRGRADDR